MAYAIWKAVLKPIDVQNAQRRLARERGGQMNILTLDF